jgi:hypothetical protein
MTDVLATTAPVRIRVEQLRLDPENPRLLRLEPEGEELTEAEMVTALLDAFDPEPIGRSIVEFGFFATEPLVVFEESGNYVVAEGNRRLVAVKLLRDEALRQAVGASEIWSTLAGELAGNAERLGHLEELPCQVVPSRADAAPVIGYRHIVGILKWDAYEKAAFVVRLLREGDGREFQAVADLTGESPNRIRRYLRDFVLLEQADGQGLNAARAKESFGRLERALNTRGVRRYIGATLPTDIAEDADSAYQEPAGRMSNLLSFLFGEPGGPEAVFSDTRRIDDLAAALDSDEGRAILEQDRDLDRAFDAAGGRKDLVLKSLQKAVSALQQAAPELAALAGDADVQAALDGVRDALAQIDDGQAAALAAAPVDGDEYDLDEEDDDEADDDPDEDFEE